MRLERKMAKRFSVILVPYDGSKPSDNAVDYAMELGRMAHSKVIILNVVEEIVTRNLTFDKPITTAKKISQQNMVQRTSTSPRKARWSDKRR